MAHKTIYKGVSAVLKQGTVAGGLTQPLYPKGRKGRISFWTAQEVLITLAFLENAEGRVVV